MATDVDNVIQLRADREPSETHYEVELDEPATGPEQFVDQPASAKPRVELRPILPSALHRGNLKPAAARSFRRVKHSAAYHAVHFLTEYLWKWLYFGFRGLIKLIDQVVNQYWMLREATQWKKEAKQASDQLGWESAHRHQKEAREKRTPKVLVGTIVILAMWALVWVYGGPLAIVPSVIVVWSVLAQYYAHTKGTAILSAAVISHRDRRINADIIVRAYSVAGLCNPEKPDERLDFLTGLERDGRGGRCTIAVPYGRTFTDVMKRRSQIASGMDVSVNQVFFTRDKISERAHEFYIADEDPLAQPAGRTPLLRLKQTDIWKPAPFGVDERGRKIGVDMLWKSILVGAQPRYGKSFSARLLGLYAALDPYVQISVFNGEAKPDWRSFKLVAHQYSSGLVMTRDGDPVEIFIQSLREIKKDVQDRYRRLSEMDVDICPEGKLTRQLARDKSLGMPVRLLIIDECQEFFNTGNPDADKEIASLLVYIVKVSPAAGMIVLDATQKPKLTIGGQMEKTFTDFRDQHTLRFALRCASFQNSDLILGAGSYTQGFDSSVLPAEEAYRGVGILLGAGMPGHTVRTYLADAMDAEKILQAAARLRKEHGTLTGQAAGDDIGIPGRDVLADTRAMFLPDERFASWEQLSARLKDQLPEHYERIGKEAISARLRNLEVPSQNGREQTGEKQVRKGVYAREIDKVLAGRGDRVL